MHISILKMASDPVCAA